MPQIRPRPAVHSLPWFDDTVAQDRGPDAEQPLDALSRLQWLSTSRAFADTGGLVSGDELAELLREQCDPDVKLQVPQPLSLVARWIVSQSVVSIDSPWGRMLPLFQFDLSRAAVHAGMRPLLAELQGVLDDVELALWFVTPNEWLNGACPAQAMHHYLPSVRLAARTDRYVALGG